MEHLSTTGTHIPGMGPEVTEKTLNSTQGGAKVFNTLPVLITVDHGLGRAGWVEQPGQPGLSSVAVPTPVNLR